METVALRRIAAAAALMVGAPAAATVIQNAYCEEMGRRFTVSTSLGEQQQCSERRLGGIDTCEDDDDDDDDDGEKGQHPFSSFFQESKLKIQRIVEASVGGSQELSDIRKAVAKLEGPLGGILGRMISPYAFFFLWRQKYQYRNGCSKLAESDLAGHKPLFNSNELSDLRWLARFTQLSYDSCDSEQQLQEALSHFEEDIPARFAGADSLGHLAFLAGRNIVQDYLGSSASFEIANKRRRALWKEFRGEDEAAAKSRRTGKWKVLHIEPISRSGAPCHFVAVNHETRSAVLCVRATKTFADAITDMHYDAQLVEYKKERATMFSKAMHFWFHSDKDAAHSGMMRSAKVLKDQHSRTLEELAKKGYRITFTGHSLGAGTAAILATQMKESLPFSRAYCYATPACMTERLARKAAPFVTTVIFDDDVIPRASTHTLLALHNELLEVETQLPAHFDQFFAEKMGNRGAGYSNNTKNSLHLAQINSQGSRDLDENIENNTPDTIVPLPDVDTQMFPPGRIIFMHRLDEEGGMRAVVAKPSYFDCIQLSPTMISDHLLASSYVQALESATQNIHKPRNLDNNARMPRNEND